MFEQINTAQLQSRVNDGARRAATILLTLGEERSSAILEHLDEAEVKVLSLAMSELGVVQTEEIGDILTEFEESLTGLQSVAGGQARTEAFLLKVLPRSKAELIIEEIRGQANRNVWKKLSSIDPNLLCGYLKGEHPQTAALILTQLPSSVAARALVSLGEAQAVEVMNRMLTLRSVHREALEALERVLHAEFLSSTTRTARKDAHEAIADVFNSLDRAAEGRLMSALENTNPPAAAKIKELMFTFDDLLKLGPVQIQTLLRDVDRNMLAQALKGASDAARAIFTDNMSARAGKMLLDDIGALPPMRMKDVEAAQAALVAHAKDKEAKGEIVIGRGDDDELV